MVDGYSRVRVDYNSASNAGAMEGIDMAHIMVAIGVVVVFFIVTYLVKALAILTSGLS